MSKNLNGNYLYHATTKDGFLGIMDTGYVNNTDGPQTATKAQTNKKTVRFTRIWNYASGGIGNTTQGHIGQDVVLVFDRDVIEQNFKTISTSQNQDVRGLAYTTKMNLGKIANAKRILDKNMAKFVFANDISTNDDLKNNAINQIQAMREKMMENKNSSSIKLT